MKLLGICMKINKMQMVKVLIILKTTTSLLTISFKNSQMPSFRK